MDHKLLAVSGMTPQIITETLYGIYRQDPAKYPSSIEVITTVEGRDRLVKNLLGIDSPLSKLQADYQLPPIAFTVEDIKIPRDDDGLFIRDVRTEREQEIITNFITDHVRKLTTNPELAIHASLAGGRKTMGFALGYAMSLFGRPQDCLSHVLVSEPYESVPDFYYPTPTSIWRTDAKKEGTHDLSLAEVTLATIPLVLMRQEMPTHLINQDNLSYTQTVDRINRANTLTFDSATVTIDFDNMSIWCDGTEVKLKPDCFTFYSWLAQDRKKKSSKGIVAPNQDMNIKKMEERLADFFRAAIHPDIPVNSNQSLGQLLDELFTAANDAISNMIQKEKDRDEENNVPEEMRQYRNIWLLRGETLTKLRSSPKYRDASNILRSHKQLWARLLADTNKSLTEVLGPRLASYYQIQTIGNEEGPTNNTPYDYKSLKLLPEHIHFK